ncbi:MAG TPA: nitrous oxide reductase accessory protein NosL [Balneolales bacterium]|nr:nitrous oxide reductase accessory protein NosL [Balneolales bacterium]
MKDWNSKILRYVLLSVTLIIASACSNNEPVPINIGRDNCTRCKMGIVNMRFASELVTSTGKDYKFDSIECMTSFYQSYKGSDVKNAKLWVHDFLHSKEWLPADSALFLRSDSLHSPMGLDLIAVKNSTEMQNIKSKVGGREMDWTDVLTYVKKNMDREK